MKKSLSVEGFDRTSFYTRSVKTSKIWEIQSNLQITEKMQTKKFRQQPELFMVPV
jgi:hypothetical protein